MAEIKLRRKIIYSGEVFSSLMDRGWSMTEAGNFLRNIREADAVEVVRCKDCKKISSSVTPIKDSVWCREFRAYMPCDGFCSYGGRRVNDVR